MRSAHSHTLDANATRPEKHRVREQRHVRKRIRASVSAGPTILSLQRSNRVGRPTGTGTQRVFNNTKDRTLSCKPCSVSADVSSTSSVISDSSEQRVAADVLVQPSLTLQRIMHTKHKVIRRAREQVIKLVNNDLVSPQDDLAANQFRLNLTSIRKGSQLNQNAHKQNTVAYDLQRQHSNYGKICHDDDNLERLKKLPIIRDRDNYHYEERNSEKKLSETHVDDGRLKSGQSSRQLCEYSTGGKFCPDSIRHSIPNRRYTRKTNKFFVPFTNGIIEEQNSKNTSADTGNFQSSKKNIKSEIRLKPDPLSENELGSRSLKTSSNHSEIALPQPSVKTFYENPYLGIERKSEELISRSTNMTPVQSCSQSTNTILFEENPTLVSEKAVQAVSKDVTKEVHILRRSFHAIRPLLFVLGMFTVSMTGAYVGVIVASATCSSSGTECEQGLLQWIFSSRRHITAV